jgi:hypothetical protein
MPPSADGWCSSLSHSAKRSLILGAKRGLEALRSIASVRAVRGNNNRCLGKEALGNGRRDLDKDQREIVKWGASSVVSVIEELELIELQVPTLGEKAGARDLDWYHLAVADGGVPGADFEALWG